MTDERALIAEIHKLPPNLQPEAVDAALELIKKLAKRQTEQSKKPPRRKAGSHPGMFVIKPDFDDPVPGFEDYM